MPRLVLLPGQRAHTGGVAEVEVEAGDFRAAVAELLRRYPSLPAAELERCTVAIDGVIVVSPFLEALSPGSEVVFVARIGAG